MLIGRNKLYSVYTNILFLEVENNNEHYGSSLLLNSQNYMLANDAINGTKLSLNTYSDWFQQNFVFLDPEMDYGTMDIYQEK